MDEHKELADTASQPVQKPDPQEKTGSPRRGNWITDIYDRMNVPVKVLDFLIVFLAVFIVAVIIIASQNR